MEYLFHILIMINIYIILCVATNLLVGMANLLSLGQAVFYGIGAYITALSSITLKIPLIPTIILVFVMSSVASLVIALPSLRLKGDYFILATLGFQLIVFTILYNWVSLTRGPFGIPGIPFPKLLGIISINGNAPFLLFSLLITLIIIFLFFRLINSPFGRVLKGLRDDELAVLSLGRNVAQFKIWAFVISSGFIGLAGFLYASYISYIDPTSFNLDESIFILAAVLIGGTGNIRGPVLGAIFVVILPELLRFLGLPESIAANGRQIIYGLALIILMRFRPQGIAGKYSFQ